MRILFLVHAFNSLAQRLHVMLAEAGHEVSVEFDINDRVTEEAVALFRPDLVLAPYLRRAIPESVWRRHRCIVIHPGIEGDRGPSALDWAIMGNEATWGVTALEATGEMDAGPVWATVEFPMRAAAKSSLYRNEVTEAAVVALRGVIERLARGDAKPRPLDYRRLEVRGRLRPLMRQQDRAIDWARDATAVVVRKIRAADGFPGVRDRLLGLECHLYDAHPEEGIPRDAATAPGTVLATREEAICLATCDGAVWVTHLKAAETASTPAGFKLPAARVLGARLAGVPDLPVAVAARVAHATWRDIVYVESDAVGYLHFPFYNGAMGPRQCERLRAAFSEATRRPTRVIVLTGGPEFWSNGIHLGLIEADEHPAEASWRNINAMNDLVRDIVCCGTHLTVAAMRGNAGAGGAFLALAADEVWARSGVVLNPHYKGMGNLYGSEYWTYLLPRRVGVAAADAITQRRLPLGAAAAQRLGLVDAQFGASVAAFEAEVHERATALATAADFARRFETKNARRRADEASRPLAAYREDELARMKLNFFGFDPSYHVARYNFVAKVPRSRTPSYLAVHRSGIAAGDPAPPRGGAEDVPADMPTPVSS